MSKHIAEKDIYGLPLNEVLKLEIFNNCRLLAGETGIHGIVSGVSQLDSPDIEKWGKPNELLLTTGFVIKDNEDAMKDLICKASARQLAGVCIKTKRFIEYVPKCMIEEADKLGVPLIELSMELKFDDIMREVLSAILDNQSKLLLYQRNVSETLLKKVVEGAEFDDLAHTLSQLLHASIMVEDTRNTRRAISLAENDMELYNGMPENEIAKLISTKQNNGECCAIPIIISNKRYGWIYVLAASSQIAERDQGVISDFAMVAALEITRESYRRKVETEHLNDFLLHLFNDKISSLDREEARAIAFGLDPQSYFAVAGIKMIYPYSNKSSKEYLNGRYSLIKDVNSFFTSNSFASYTARDADSYIFVISPGQEEAKMERFAEVVKELFRYLKKGYPELSFKISCGNLHNGITGIVQSYREAMMVTRVNDSLKDKNYLLHFKEIGIYRFILSNDPQSEIKRYVDETLGKLIEYDRSKNNELMLTLAAYFDNYGNLSKMSKSIHTHYNTIIYRLNRIEEITGMQLRDPDDRLNLEIALKLNSIRREMI